MVNVLHCELSRWRGDGELCRWCNQGEPRAGRRFCSRECAASFANNHQYFRGRWIVLAWHRNCDCRSMSPSGAVLVGAPPRVSYLFAPPPHVVCNACGECEQQMHERDDKVSVNHIVPRNGIPMSKVDCIHHLENLEPLCLRCHSILNQIGNRRELLDRELARRWIT